MEEQQQYRQKSRKRRFRRVLIIAVVVVVVIVIVALVVGLTLRSKSKSEHDTFKQVFLSRCEASQRNDCPKIWSAFEQAYVSKDPCTVPPEAYNPLLEAAPFTPACNRMLFWSKTKDVVHDFTDKRNCHVTLEDTLLGTVLDGLTWCGKEGSNETFTSGCPDWDACDNPHRSFWIKASASYAEVACGNVSVMLSGSIQQPFSPGSIFESVEVKHFNPDIMKSLNVVLVTQEKVKSNCTNASLKNLQKQLAQGIAYSCQEVPQSQIEECASDPTIPCGACW